MSLMCLNLAQTLEDGHSVPPPPIPPEKWEETITCARRNKLNILLERSLSPEDHDAAQYKDFIKENQKVALTNSRILHLIHKTHLTLESAGINHVFYKGPLQQKILYGDFFSKKVSMLTCLWPVKTSPAPAKCLSPLTFRFRQNVTACGGGCFWVSSTCSAKAQPPFRRSASPFATARLTGTAPYRKIYARSR